MRSCSPARTHKSHLRFPLTPPLLAFFSLVKCVSYISLTQRQADVRGTRLTPPKHGTPEGHCCVTADLAVYPSPLSRLCIKSCFSFCPLLCLFFCEETTVLDSATESLMLFMGLLLATLPGPPTGGRSQAKPSPLMLFRVTHSQPTNWMTHRKTPQMN